MTYAALTRWDPLWDVIGTQDLRSRTFGECFARPLEADGQAWYPVVDITEENDKLVLRAEIPGVGRDDIDLRVENGTFTLRGEKKLEHAVDSENSYRSERFYGAFSRSFVLPTTVDASAIKATYKDGVLEVVLPKSPEARPRKIEVVPA
jgi:HSP20 family protein